MKFIVFLVSAAVLCVGFSACVTEPYTAGTCGETADCHSLINNQPEGSECDANGMCRCPVGTKICCPKGSTAGHCTVACLAFSQCADDPGADAGTDDGGTTLACASDNDCPQPPSPECGKGSCINGACNLQIKIGPLESQLYGDCTRRDCDTWGTLVDVDDSSDFYNDGRECTIDFCKNGQPVNQSVGDGTACPESGQGYCYQLSCVECIDSLPGAMCGAPGVLACYSFWCAPFPQCNNQCGGLCPPCATGQACANDLDCLSLHCEFNMCSLPTCADGRRNGSETGIDCGAASCGLCPVGQGCDVPANCESNVCKAGVCQAPTCLDGVQNGGEAGTDCGGVCKNACP